MSTETYKYLLYDSFDDALERADAEGARLGYSYHKIGRGTRYCSYPKETTSGKFALTANKYLLTDEEETATVTSVTFKD